jgi:hypothetical protein
MKALVLSACLLACAVSMAQSPEATKADPPSFANYTIMLVNPVAGAGAVVLMHNPKNELEFVDVAKIQAALTGGYVPVRAAELGQFIASMKEEISRLSTENARLQNAQQNSPTLAVQETGLNETNCHTYDWLKNATVDQLKTCAALYPASNVGAPPSPSPAELAAQRDAQLAADRAARRQQIIQSWLMLQNMNRPAQPYQLPMPVNPNANRLQTNCTMSTIGNVATTNCN